MATKEPKILIDEHRDGCYVKAWKCSRSEFDVAPGDPVPTCEPEGDWAMPVLLGLSVCVPQAIAQTRNRRYG